VRARLVEVQAASGLSRNALAVALLSPGLGLADVPDGARVGWWMRQRIGGGAAAAGLTADELPLALLQIDANAVPAWIDTDSARRRLSPPPGGAGDALWPESWTVEMQAFAAQFIAQLADDKAAAADFTWLPPVLPLTKVQLDHFRKLLAGAPTTIEVLNRARFARALVEGWEGEPVLRSGAQLYLAQLEGHADRLLLRAVGQGGRSGDTSLGSGAGERTSARVASAAARVLAAGRSHREGGPSKDELAAAASALTQTPDRLRR
jgi:hypothetical protein